MATNAISLLALDERQKGAFDGDGYLIVRGLYTPAEIAEMRDRFHQLLREPAAAHPGLRYSYEKPEKLAGRPADPNNPHGVWRIEEEEHVMDTRGLAYPERPQGILHRAQVVTRVTRRVMLASTATGVLSAGCARRTPEPATPAAPTGPVKLTHWQHHAEGRKATVDHLIEAYRQQFPQAEISFDSIPWGEYWDKLTAALVANEGPDSFQLPMGLLPLYIGREQLVPADPAVVGRAADEFLPWTIERMKRGSQLFGLPVDVQTMVLYCNDEVFSRDGVDVTKAPRDWEGVEQWARSLTKVAGGETQQIGIDLSYYSAGSELVFQQKLQPTPMVDPKSNTVNWGRPEVLEAFTWYTSMVQRYGDYTFKDRAFWQGHAGMTIGHPVSRSSFAQQAPNLQYTIHHFPPPGGKPPLTIGSHWAWVVSNQSRQQKEAWRWIAFATSDESEFTWYRMAGDLPSRKKVVDDPSLRQTPNDVMVMDSMKSARPWSWIGWADWVRVYNEAVLRVVKGEQGPKESLAQAAEEINRVIQENLPPK